MPLFQPAVCGCHGSDLRFSTNAREPENLACLNPLDSILLQKCPRDSTSIGVLNVIAIEGGNQDGKSIWNGQRCRREVGAIYRP